MFNIDTNEQIFICGHRASGGGLLMSLLDFHPELLVYPDESKFFYLFYPIMDDKNLNADKKIKYLINHNLEYLKNILFKKCKSTDKYFNFNSFIDRFKILASDGLNWDDYLKAMIQSYAEHSPQNKNEIKFWVERTTCSEIYYLEIIKVFPKSKFIHNVRDPRDNYASLKSRWDSKLKYLSDSTSLEALRQSCIQRSKLGLTMGLLNKKLGGNKKYYFSKYEDLVNDLEGSLYNISKFLNINPDSLIKTPTFCGLPWIGNNFSGKKFKEVSNVQVGKWRERITDYEAALMEFHFKDFMKIFGYKIEYSDREQLYAASKHYKWLNFKSSTKADLKLATKVKFK